MTPEELACVEAVRRSREERMHRTSWLLVSALANHACCTPESILGWLTGSLWDAEEVNSIKQAGRQA